MHLLLVAMHLLLLAFCYYCRSFGFLVFSGTLESRNHPPRRAFFLDEVIVQDESASGHVFLLVEAWSTNSWLIQSKHKTDPIPRFALET